METKMIKNNVVELRQYTLYRGKRDTMIELFERELIEPQNALGARVLGTFRDLDDPDRFVWMRGFDSMDARAKALESFYTGPVWLAHREAANATMVDSDNALLLRPAGKDGLANAVSSTTPGIITATIYDLGQSSPADFTAFFEAILHPRLKELGASPFASLLTEGSPNNFPRLPVRGGVPVFVWLARWPDERAATEFDARFATASGWRDNAPATVLPALMRKPERLRLAPTTRSRLR